MIWRSAAEPDAENDDEREGQVGPPKPAKSTAEEIKKQQKLLRQELARNRREIERFRAEFASLQDLYRGEVAHVVASSAADVNAIGNLREQAEQVVQLLQGGSLFGRYARDADGHAVAANRWRRFAVIVLLATTGLELALAAGLTSLSGLQLAVPVVPMLLLFTYASVESHNHRRSELDRRRIYLRMAAIESYTQRRNPNGVSAEELEGILREFIEQHFIAADLDPNAVSSVGVRSVGPLRFWHRSRSEKV